MPEAPLTLYLIRHAEPVAPGDPRYEENERPLSERGRDQATMLATGLASLPLDGVYSSPYPRAVQTVGPLARRHGQGVILLDDLRERLLSAEPLPDWRERLEEAWRDHDLALPGGESGRQAQQRAIDALEAIAARHPSGGTVVAASHGNLIALALNALEPGVDFAFWSQIPMPAVFTLQRSQGVWTAVSGPGL